MKVFRLSALSVALCFAVHHAMATEGGGSSYPVGVETNYSGLMLPEGQHVLLYYQHYAAERAADGGGSDNARFARFGMRADVLALRYSHVWSGIRIAGAQLESRVVLPLPSLTLDLAIARPAPLSPLDKSGSASGVGDISVAPLLLGWHSPSLHQMAGFELVMPSGAYDVARNLNTGRNYWQAALIYGLSWMPQSWEASARIRYGVNGRNAATDYRSGDELSLEFSGGYRLGGGWSAGVNGYVYRQLSDDRQAGLSVAGDGNRASVNALGPYLAWSMGPRMGIVAKYQQESSAKNRAEGGRLWVQARYAF